MLNLWLEFYTIYIFRLCGACFTAVQTRVGRSVLSIAYLAVLGGMASQVHLSQAATVSVRVYNWVD